MVAKWMKYSVTQKDKQLGGVASPDVPFIIQFGMDGDVIVTAVNWVGFL